MRIKTFSPEMAGVPPENNLEQKMVHSDVLTSDDIKSYAKFIVDGLNALKNSSEQEKEAFIVDAFSDDKISEKIGRQRMSDNAGEPIEIDEDEALSAIKRVRQALMEELKGKIDEKIYLISSDIIRKTGKTSIINLNAEKKKIGRKNIISEVVDVTSGKERIYKDQDLILKEHINDTIEAFALFNKLAPHANIVNIKEYDQSGQRAIYEKLNLQSFDPDLFAGEASEYSFATALKVLKDCMEGAAYLADNGLVLQDIKLNNLGVVETEEGEIKGVLFDLEGLLKTGTKMYSRLGTTGYLPPELSSTSPEAYYKLSPKEMVFQLGLCIQDVVWIFLDDVLAGHLKSNTRDSANLNTIRSLRILAKKMTEKKPEQRIDLTEAKNELEVIIGNLK